MQRKRQINAVINRMIGLVRQREGLAREADWREIAGQTGATRPSRQLALLSFLPSATSLAVFATSTHRSDGAINFLVGAQETIGRRRILAREPSNTATLASTTKLICCDLCGSALPDRCLTTCRRSATATRSASGPRSGRAGGSMTGCGSGRDELVVVDIANENLRQFHGGCYDAGREPDPVWWYDEARS